MKLPEFLRNKKPYEQGDVVAKLEGRGISTGVVLKKDKRKTKVRFRDLSERWIVNEKLTLIEDRILIAETLGSMLEDKIVKDFEEQQDINGGLT